MSDVTVSSLGTGRRLRQYLTGMGCVWHRVLDLRDTKVIRKTSSQRRRRTERYWYCYFKTKFEQSIISLSLYCVIENWYKKMFLLEEQLGKIVNPAVTNVGSSPNQLIFSLTSFGRHWDRNNNGTVASMRINSQSIFCCCQEKVKTTSNVCCCHDVREIPTIFCRY
jgi:hypothetical protein